MGNDGDRTVALARGAVAVLSLSAIVLILSVLGGAGGDDWGGKMILAVIVFVPFSLTATAGVVLIERQPQWTFFGVLTVILSAAAYFVVLDAAWSSGLQGRHVAVETLVIVVLAAAQASMLLSFWRDDDSPLASWALLGSLGALALLGVLTIFEVSDPGSDVSYKLFAILSVLYLLCALLPPLLRRAELDA